jgi:protein-S-isoprenylcysteine O-methyltransferase Ste14
MLSPSPTEGPARGKIVGGGRPPWWKGARGEWYVVAQLGLFALLFFGPRRLHGWPAWPAPVAAAGTFAGIPHVILGVSLALAGIFRLGPHLTPLPYPKDGSVLLESGAYGVVRHPIYGGGLLAAFGWGLWAHGVLTLLYAVLLVILFDLKARREERWLCERFPGYAGYQKRVRRLVPFLY